MRKLLSYIIKQPDHSNRDMLRIILIDALTIGIGFIIMVRALVAGHSNQDAMTAGAVLFIIGVLIRVWRRDFKSK